MYPLFGPVPQPGPLEIILVLAVGLGVPLVIAGLLGKVVVDWWRGTGPAPNENRQDAPAGDRWWWIIAAQPALYLLLVLVGIAYTLSPAPVQFPTRLPFILVGLGWLFKFAGPVAVYFDRKYVATISDWRPSLAYFLVVAPLAGVLLAAIYVYERHQYIGVP